METIDKKPRKKARAQIPQSVRFNVFRRDNFTCRYCGKSSSQVILHCDHAVSVKDGGGDGEKNLVTACVDCNQGKSAQSVAHPFSKASDDKAGDVVGLVGLWGHTFIDHHCLPGRKMVQWQFKIIRAITPDLHLCQLFSWLDGDPTNCETISTKSLVEDCKLYGSNAQMLTAYEKECEQHKDEIARIGGYGAAIDRYNTWKRSQFG